MPTFINSNLYIFR